MRILTFVILTLVSCGQYKYEITNMLPETIDVTDFITSGEFRPYYCEERFEKLIRTTPRTLDSSYEQKLQKNLRNWVNNYNDWLRENNQTTIDLSIDDLFLNTSYQYSYFIISEPIDVYRTDLGVDVKGNQNFKLFMRLDKNGKVFMNYNEESWILDNCDIENSIMQRLYEKY